MDTTTPAAEAEPETNKPETPAPKTAAEEFDRILEEIDLLDFGPDEVKGMQNRISALGRAMQLFAYRHAGAFSATVVLYDGHALASLLEGEQAEAVAKQIQAVTESNLARPAGETAKAAIMEYVSVTRLNSEPGELAALTRHCAVALEEYAERSLTNAPETESSFTG